MLLEQCQEAVSPCPVILSGELEFDNGDPEQFQDLIHLSGQGRREYTQKLCQSMGED